MAEMCWQAEPVWAGETEQPMKEQQKLEKIIFEEVWNERPAAKGVLNGEKWKPFAEGIAKALIEAIVLWHNNKGEYNIACSILKNPDMETIGNDGFGKNRVP